MRHKLKYFKKFLDDPASFPNDEFYRKLRKWGKYIDEHKNEFNYLKDDEWKEIRERVLAELERREDIKDEFYEFNERFETIREIKIEERFVLYREWLEFMRENKFDFGFTDEQISGLEERLKSLIQADQKYQLSVEKSRLAKIEVEKSIEELADEMFEYYERTGKRPVLTSINPGTKLKGN